MNSNSIRINDYYRIGKGHVFHGNLASFRGRAWEEDKLLSFWNV